MISAEESKTLNVTMAPFDEVVAKADFLSLHTALTDETRTMIGKSQLEMMKPSAYLINTGRGELIDEKALYDADVIMMLRIQKERQQNFLYSTEREYATVYGLTKTKLQKARNDVLIMHPGPINRGVEIACDVADGPYSIILDQVKNGVAVRMAVLYLVAGGVHNADGN